MEYGTLIEYLELTPADISKLDNLSKELHEIMSGDKKSKIAIVETYQAFCDVVAEMDKHHQIFLMFKNYHLTQILYSLIVKICGAEVADKLIVANMKSSTTNGDEETKTNGGG